MCAYWASIPRSMRARVPATSAAPAASASPDSAARTRPPLHRKDLVAVMCVSPHPSAEWLVWLRCRVARTLTSPDHRYGRCLVDHLDTLRVGCASLGRT